MTGRVLSLAPVVALVAALAPARAGAQEHRLAVAVWSDLAPGTEFDAVEVSLDGAVRSQPVTPAMDFEADAAWVHDAPCADGAHALGVVLLLGVRRVVSRSMQVVVAADREVVLQLDRCDGACAAECIEGRCASAPASLPPLAVLSEVEASSTRGAARASRALDADLATAWCPSRAGATLTVRFAEPVSLRSVTAHGGEAGDADEEATPLALTVTSDTGATTALMGTSRDQGTTIALSGEPTRALVFRVAPRASGPARPHDGCLWEIHLDLVDRVMVYGVPAEALDSLEAAITHLDRALLRCDEPALTQLARFPVAFRETSMEEPGAYATRGSRSDRAAYRTAHAIPCSWAAARRPDTHAPRPVPHLEAGIAPGVVRVRAGVAIAQVYWELAWTRGRWRLVSIDSVFFE